VCGQPLFYRLLSIYLDIRTAADRRLKAAVEQFHSSVASMLKTPKDVPDEILQAIDMLSKTAFAPGSERHLARIIRNGKQPSPRSRDMMRDLAGMRPEMQDLFALAAVSWITIMTHKSVVGGIRVASTLERAGTGRISRDAADTAIPAVGKMVGASCAA